MCSEGMMEGAGEREWGGDREEGVRRMGEGWKRERKREGGITKGVRLK